MLSPDVLLATIACGAIAERMDWKLDLYRKVAPAIASITRSQSRNRSRSSS